MYANVGILLESLSASQKAGSDPWLGKTVDGRYRITQFIGRGAMGRVYKVEHARIGKVAAMKILHGTLTANSRLRARFRQEAEAISKLDHPNIIQVFDFGDTRGTFFLVMEYVRGKTLGALLKENGFLPIQRCLPILAQICAALTEAHEAGIIHRDLKPDNIQVSQTRSGRDYVKVLDFGLAKFVNQSANDTAKGNIVGTPYYMAPEQIRGETVDHRTDIYSLGAVVFRMLSGKAPFNAQSPVGVLTKHITESVPSLAAVAPERLLSPELDGVVQRAMAKTPSDRYRSANEFKVALVTAVNRSLSGAIRLPASELSSPHASYQGHESEGESPTNNISVALSYEDLAFERRLARRARRRSLIVAAILLALGGGVAYWFLLHKPTKHVLRAEVEPNNKPAEARAASSGVPILGKIGKRLTEVTSDQDWYQITIPDGSRHELKVTVTAIPNIDLKLSLYDRAGDLAYSADDTGIGGDERITNWPLDPGTYYILIHEIRNPGTRPTENVTDSYELAISFRPMRAGWEDEPNDEPKQATHMSLDKIMHGYLGSVTDVDSYRVQCSGGELEGMVTPLVGADVVIDVLFGRNKKKRFDRGKTSVGERIHGIRCRPGQIVRIQLRTKRPSKEKRPSVPWIAKPYSLKVWRHGL